MAASRSLRGADMAEPTAIEDLPEETRRIALKALQFREENVSRMQLIEQLGGAVEIANARLEHLLYSLIELGVITEQAMWQINLEWEKKLRPQLIESLSALQRVRRQEAARPRLIVPGSNGSRP